MLTKIQEDKCANANKLAVSDVLTNGNIVLAVSHIITVPGKLPTCVVMCVIPGNSWTPFVTHIVSFMCHPDKGADADGVPWDGRWATAHGDYERLMCDAIPDFGRRMSELGVEEAP